MDQLKKMKGLNKTSQMVEWQPIAQLLKEVYQEQNIIEFFEEDEAYLKSAFFYNRKSLETAV